MKTFDVLTSFSYFQQFVVLFEVICNSIVQLLQDS